MRSESVQNKQNKFWHRVGQVIRSVLFLLILAAVIGTAIRVVERKSSHQKYADFFDTADQLDVLFLGSSHVINGINPVQLYEDHGYTSYNMGGHGSVLPSTYWELENALNYCNPKYVVVDTYLLEKDYHYLDEMDSYASESDIRSSIEQLHLNMDCWPLTQTKIAAVKDLIHDPNIQREFLFDFELYHDRWNELDADDFGVLNGSDKRNLLMGAEQRFEVDSVPVITQPDLTQTGTLPYETEGVKYLKKIITECQKRQIKVILTYLPVTDITSGDITQAGTVSAAAQAAGSAAQLAREYDIPFLNMLEKNELADPYLNFNDDGHLNAAGMWKVTDYIGTYLSEHTKLQDHRGQKGYDIWDQRVESSDQVETDAALSQKDLYDQLMVFGAEKSNYVVYIKTGSPAMQDKELLRILEDLSGSTQAENAAQSGGPYLLLTDIAQKHQEEFLGEAEPGAFDTTGGSMEYIGLSDFAAVYMNGDEDHNLLDMDAGYNSDVQVLVFDTDTGVFLKRFCYRDTGESYELQ